MTKYRVEKNPDSPGGRKDWEGRSPRVRLAFTHPQLAVLKELFDAYFIKYPDKLLDPEYLNLQERIGKANLDIQKPLTQEVDHSPLWDDDV